MHRAPALGDMIRSIPCSPLWPLSPGHSLLWPNVWGLLREETQYIGTYSNIPSFEAQFQNFTLLCKHVPHCCHNTTFYCVWEISQEAFLNPVPLVWFQVFSSKDNPVHHGRHRDFQYLELGAFTRKQSCICVFALPFLKSIQVQVWVSATRPCHTSVKLGNKEVFKICICLHFFLRVWFPAAQYNAYQVTEEAEIRQ